MRMGRKYLKEFIIELRDKRKEELGINSFILSLNGMNGSGKSYQVKQLEDRIRKGHEISTVNVFRPTSVYKTPERVEYMKNMVETLEENPDDTIKIYTKEAVQAWRTFLPIAKREGVLIIDRDAYSSLAIQMIIRNLHPNSRETLEIAEKLFTYPITPPDLAIFTISDLETALRREEDRREDLMLKSQGDAPSKYYKVAYKKLNNEKEIPDNEKLIWWYSQLKKTYEILNRHIPNSELLVTGENDREGLNPTLFETFKSKYNQFMSHKREIVNRSMRYSASIRSYKKE